MQVSHRFLSDRLEQSGRAENNTLTGFHTSLLEVLPHAAAYVAQDGSVLVHNKQMKALCAAKGVFPVPVSLPSLLSETSWRRCEAVLSAAFSGVPAQASGAIVLQSGETFCHHMICTSFVSLSGERQAVLVQFDLEEHGQDEIVTLPEPARNEIRSAKSARDLDLLEHFPDDVLVFDGSESLNEMAGK